MDEKFHIPVMCGEVINYLNLAAGKKIVDATIGMGGHSLKIIEGISPGGKLIGIDRDEDAIKTASSRLGNCSSSCEFVYGNFIDIDKILAGVGVQKIDGILLDLGVSSAQLDDPLRGFSFQNEGPLDMRLDRNSYISAYDLVNNLNEDELSELLLEFRTGKVAQPYCPLFGTGKREAPDLDDLRVKPGRQQGNTLQVQALPDPSGDKDLSGSAHCGQP